MKRIQLPVVIFTLGFLLLPGCAQRQNETENEPALGSDRGKQNENENEAYLDFEQLFDDPESFIMKGEAEWEQSSGVWLADIDSGAGFLMTSASYRNFELQVDFMPDSTINSGVFIRCAGQELSPEDCYELNIWDLHPNQEYRTGAVVTRASPLNFVSTIGAWNTYKIIANNDHVVAWINETLVIDLRDDTRKDGYIGIQAAGKGNIQFRNLRIISKAE